MLVFAFVCIHGAAAACGICTSTLSYDLYRFTPVWLVLALVGAGAAGIAGQGTRVDGNQRQPIRLVAPLGWYFLILTLVWLWGLHLAGAIYAPVLLSRYTGIRIPGSPTQYVGPRWLRGFMLALVGIAFLSVPLSYLLLPKTAYEIAARSDTSWIKSRIRETISSPGLSGTTVPLSACIIIDGYSRSVVAPEYSTIISLPEDRFRYRVEQGSPFSWLIGYNLFRRPGGDPLSTVQYASSGTQVLMWSRGPDAIFDIDGQLGQELVSLQDDERLRRSINLLYDPTNGSVSPGDVVIKHPEVKP